MDTTDPKQSAPTIATLLVTALIAPWIAKHAPVFTLTPDQVSWMQDAIATALVVGPTWAAHAWHTATLKTTAALKKSASATASASTFASPKT